jgi:hypothetical protein
MAHPTGESSYDRLLGEASRQMLGKEHPEGRDDWVKVMNFVAWNVDFRTCLQVCYEIVQLNNVPLGKEEVQDIVDFQTYDRAARELSVREKTVALLSDGAIREVNEFFNDGFEEKGKQGTTK